MISFKNSFWAFLFLSFSAACFALAPEDKEAIEKSIADYTQAWNERRMDDFSKAYSLDASFVNVLGGLSKGRLAIAKRHLKMHENYKSRLEIKEITLRKVRDGMVIALITWEVEHSGMPKSLDSSSDTREGLWTQVFLKEGDEWLITASHNTFISSEKR